MGFVQRRLAGALRDRGEMLRQKSVNRPCGTALPLLAVFRGEGDVSLSAEAAHSLGRTWPHGRFRRATKPPGPREPGPASPLFCFGLSTGRACLGASCVSGSSGSLSAIAIILGGRGDARTGKPAVDPVSGRARFSPLDGLRRFHDRVMGASMVSRSCTVSRTQHGRTAGCRSLARYALGRQAEANIRPRPVSSGRMCCPMSDSPLLISGAWWMGGGSSKTAAAQGRWDSCLPIMKRRVPTLMARPIAYHVARLKGRGEFRGKGATTKSHVSDLVGRASMARLMTWNATGDDGAAPTRPTLRRARGRVMKVTGRGIWCSRARSEMHEW